MSDLRDPYGREPLPEFLVDNDFKHYQPTDMQFNIGRLEGGPLRGYDLVNPVSRERILLARDSSIDSERLVRLRLGRLAIPPRMPKLHPYDSYDIYYMPFGARLLIKTLRAAPYNPDYMANVTDRVGVFMRRLHQLDPGLFGLTLTTIAVGHDIEDGERDDVALMVVPPLAAPGQAEALEPLEVAALTLPLLASELRAAFMQGFAPEHRGEI